MVLSGYSGTKTGRHDIAEILLKVALKHQQIKSNKKVGLGSGSPASLVTLADFDCLGILVFLPIFFQLFGFQIFWLKNVIPETRRAN